MKLGGDVAMHVIELLSQAGIHGLKKMPLALDCAR